MNYVGLLTKEEKAILCEIITGKEFKELFKKKEQGIPLIIAPKPAVLSSATRISRKSAIQAHCLHAK